MALEKPRLFQLTISFQSSFYPDSLKDILPNYWERKNINFGEIDSEKNKIVWNSRFYVFLWLVIIAYSFWIGSILPVIYILLPNYYGKPIQFFVNVKSLGL